MEWGNHPLKIRYLSSNNPRDLKSLDSAVTVGQWSFTAIPSLHNLSVTKINTVVLVELSTLSRQSQSQATKYLWLLWACRSRPSKWHSTLQGKFDLHLPVWSHLKGLVSLSLLSSLLPPHSPCRRQCKMRPAMTAVVNDYTTTNILDTAVQLARCHSHLSHSTILINLQ